MDASKDQKGVYRQPAGDGIERRALLVASQYEGTRWPLGGCYNDVRVMKELIACQPFGFKPDKITVLIREDATRCNILKHLQHLCDEAPQGSVVFFLFCGHGCYLKNIEDEGIIPSDFTDDMLLDEDKLRDICITGKEFVPYLETLSKKDVCTTLMFDCCHSGHIYRGHEFKDSKFKLLRPRQITPSAESPQLSRSAKCQYAGWRPSNVDKFFHIAACSSVEKAHEGIYNGLPHGLMTFAVHRVLSRLQDPSKVSYKALCSLIVHECEELGVATLQTPQFEGGNINTTVFGRDTVPDVKAIGIKVLEVIRGTPGGGVVLDAGRIQLLYDGEYDVFEPTVSNEEMASGQASEQLVASVDVNKRDISDMRATAYVINVKEGKQIRYGCVAYLRQASSMRHHIVVRGVADEPGATEELLAYLEKSSMFNVMAADAFPGTNAKGDLVTSGALASNGPEHMITEITDGELKSGTPSEDRITGDVIKNSATEDMITNSTGDLKEDVIMGKGDGSEPREDIITMSCEQVQGSKRWVARRVSKVIAPPISLGRENVMVDNLCRLLRYEMALVPLDSNDALMTNVTFKVTKLVNVTPYQGVNQRNERIEDGLKNRDLYADAPLIDRPRFHSHLVDESSGKPIRKPESGDAVVYEIKNNEKTPIHVCVLMFQLDGSVMSLYPDRHGMTQELRPGGTIKGIQSLYVPSGSLRAIACPDPREPEPPFGVEIVMLYVTSKPASYAALLQPALEIESELAPRAPTEPRSPLNPLSEFRLAIKNRNCLDEFSPDELAWLVEKREFELWKYDADKREKDSRDWSV